MFDRNSLVHLIIWPKSPDACYHLVDQDGELAGTVPVVTPQRGTDIARMLPADFEISTDDCTVVTMSGVIKVATSGGFDTAVVTERNTPSIEERFQRLERRERRRELREKALAAENQRLLAQSQVTMEEFDDVDGSGEDNPALVEAPEIADEPEGDDGDKAGAAKQKPGKSRA